VTTFAPLYVPAALGDAVSGRAWLGAMLEAEGALARAGALVGAVPTEAATAIAGACDVDAFDWETLLREGRSVGNPAEPLVRALVERVGEKTGRFVHLGATSQDIVDSAAMLVARRGLGLVLPDLGRVADATASLARTHRDTPMAGRTMLQHAVPTTFGLKAAGWLVALLDAGTRLSRVRAEGLAAQLGGAAGTLAGLGDSALDVSAHYARELDLPEATVPWHTNRIRVAELGAALALVCGVASKLGLDLQLLAQTEVGEVRFAGHGGGSSAMPQKRNPVDAMWARAAGELGRGHASVLIAAPAGEHERAGGAWQAEWDAISGALAATGGAVAALARGLDGLEVDAARMHANLDMTGGGIVSERLALELTERMGRTAARELARDASARASSEGITLAEALAQVDTGLSGAELDALLDPTTYLGASGALVDRALARYAAEREGLSS
jgi:3-carboxy-cis,cis-muconate cycloisomerase